MTDKCDTDRENLDAALQMIRKRVPDAVSVDLATSDQGSYGFVLMEVNLKDGKVLSQYGAGLLFDEVDANVCDLLSDIDWDGVVGEDAHGYKTITL